MKKKIRRRCKCGCGRITNYGRKYIHGHNRCGISPSKETRLKTSLTLTGRKIIKEIRKKMSKSKMGKKQSAKHILNKSLARIKCNPNYPYCDIWKDGEYKKDLRKDYCENKGCKKISKRFVNHHIYLDKKRCAPNDIMTLCASCHIWLHHKLKQGKKIAVDPKYYIIINRIDHVSYIYKPTRKIIRINKTSQKIIKKCIISYRGVAKLAAKS